MNPIIKNWWKVLVIVLTALVARILLLQLLPLRSSSTFELPPSALSQAIGMIPTAAIVVTLAYAVIALILLIVQEGLGGNRLSRVIRCSVPFGLLWFMGVLESVPALGKPLLPEFLIGVTDIIPVLLIGVLISLGISKGEHPSQGNLLPRVGLDILVIAFTYLVGRYLAYAVIHINSGYSTRPEATFWWTLAMGLAVGVAYSFWRDSVQGRTPLAKGLWFGIVAFGLYWALNNFFMPLLFDISFIQFDPPIMNYVFRVAVDVLFVILGVWIVEKTI